MLLGQYQGEAPLRFKINGNYLGTPRSFDFKFNVENATTRNSYVPRLWANRKIAYLIDQIRQMGADRNQSSGRTKELVDEIVRLSTKFGILTEYTSFLATEENMAVNGRERREEYQKQAAKKMEDQAMNVRSGMGAVSQEMNVNAQKAAPAVSRLNSYYDQSMKKVEITNVQQIADRTFFNRNNQWIDAQLMEGDKAIKADSEIEFGTPAFDKFVSQLVSEGRQGILALGSDTLLMLDGKTVLIKMPSQNKTQ